MKTNHKHKEELFNELTFEAFQEDADYDVFTDYGIPKDQFTNDSLALIRKLNFKAKVELGKIKNQKANDLIKNKVLNALERGTEEMRQKLISLIHSKNPQFQFRKLKDLDEVDLDDLLNDIDILNALEEIDN